VYIESYSRNLACLILGDVSRKPTLLLNAGHIQRQAASGGCDMELTLFMFIIYLLVHTPSVAPIISKYIRPIFA